MKNKGIGENIRFYRKKASMTQAELARLVGYKNQATIARIEQNKRDIPLSMVEVIAKALNIPVYLLFEELPSGIAKEFVPYLEKAEVWQLDAIRKILDMPSKKIYQSIVVVG